MRPSGGTSRNRTDISSTLAKAGTFPHCSVSPPGHYSGGQVFPCSQLKEGDSTTPKYRPCGAAYRTRTGDTCLEGRGVTTTPMLRITAGAFNRRAVCPGCHASLTSALPPCSPYGGAGLSLQSRQKKKRGDHPGGHKPGGGWSGIRTQLPSACADGCTSDVLPTHVF